MPEKKSRKIARKKSVKKAAKSRTTGVVAKKQATRKTAAKKVAGQVAKKKTTKAKSKTIAVDFDGVIHLYSSGFQDGTIYDDPVPGAKAALEQMKAEGYKIYIFSTRSNKIYRKKDSIDQNQAMEDYLNKHGIPFDRIWSFGKPMADIYIDDRAIGFRGDWDQTMHEVQNFKVWNQKD